MASKHRVDAAFWNGVLVEGYWFSPDEEVDLPKHSHDEYQVGLALTHPGEYVYRGGYHPVPVRSVTVIHPGETHSGCGFRRRIDAVEFRSFYIPPQIIQRRLSEQTGKENAAIPFVTPITLNAELNRRLRKFYQGVMRHNVDLELETLWHDLLDEIFGLECSYDIRRDPEPQAGVRLVRDFLNTHPEEHITLEDLARMAGLTPSHLSRSFHRKLGMPLHRYQTQRRIDRAKRLLIEGKTPAETALLTGFSHQSHFGRYFRELVQIGPAAYQANSWRKHKNVISQATQNSIHSPSECKTVAKAFA